MFRLIEVVFRLVVLNLRVVMSLPVCYIANCTVRSSQLVPNSKFIVHVLIISM